MNDEGRQWDASRFGRFGFGRGVAVSVLVLASVWAILGGPRTSWAIGVPVVLLCAVANGLLPPARPWHLTLRGALLFVPFFLNVSIQGGLGVARSAARPRMGLARKLIRYRLRLPVGPSRIFFAHCISLLPGTLSCALEEDIVKVHALFGHAGVEEELNRLETRVASLFGEPHA